MRPPLVAGLEAVAGTSTVAAALHGRDGGRCERGADVVVCGARPESLRLAGALEFPPTGLRPVLAVALAPSAPPPPLPRLHALDARFGALVLIPFVETWTGPEPSLDEAASVLGHPVEHLPRSLRSYAAALRAITAALLRSGQLHHPRPPVARPRAITLWHGLDVERPAPQRPKLVAVPAPAGLPRADAPRQAVDPRVRNAPAPRAPAPDPSAPDPSALDDDDIDGSLDTPAARLHGPAAG
ncbi:hypothetical protein [Pseudonocardia sp. GCM10023141]|uniref:hypothetical protein n=1 Tax=Pseudonocardia sp. GCM10023141 TaxID=3252653 RepID=UPI0036180215